MFTGSIQVKLDPKTQDRFPQRIAGLKLWPEVGFTGAGERREAALGVVGGKA